MPVAGTEMVGDAPGWCVWDGTADGQWWRCARCGSTVAKTSSTPPWRACPLATGPRSVAGQRAAAATGERLLLVLRKGLGDAVQLTPALRQWRATRPDVPVDVVCFDYQRPLFRGLCDRAFGEVEQAEAALAVEPGPVRRVYLDPPEPPFALWSDSPSGKAAWITRHLLGVAPAPEHWGYWIETTPDDQSQAAAALARLCGCERGSDGRFPAVLVHYQGHSFGRRKNLPEHAVLAMCRRLLAAGLVPLLLDLERRSRIRLAGVAKLHGDDRLFARGQSPALLKALCDQARLVVAIDSGPGHVAAAVNPAPSGDCTPTLVAMTQQHPLLFFEPAAHVTHLVPARASEMIADAGARGFFEREYRRRTYFSLEQSLGMLALELAVAGPRDAAASGGAALEAECDVWTRPRQASIDRRIAAEQMLADDYRTAECRDSAVEYVLDVGAHCGAFLRRARFRWGARAKLAGVEPNPDTWDVLAANAAECGAVVLRAAVGYPREGEAPRELLLCDDSCMAIAARADLAQVQADREAHRKTWRRQALACEVLTLEEVQARLGWPRVDVLKLDCEGSERELLERASDRWLAQLRYIVGEWHQGEAWFREVFARRLSPRGWELSVLARVGDCGLFRLANRARLTGASLGPLPTPRNTPRTPAVATGRGQRRLAGRR